MKFLKNRVLLENQDRVLKISRCTFLKKIFDYWSHYVSELLHRYKEVTVATDYFNWDTARLAELCSTQHHRQETMGQLEVTGELALESLSSRCKTLLQLLQLMLGDQEAFSKPSQMGHFVTFPQHFTWSCDLEIPVLSKFM